MKQMDTQKNETQHVHLLRGNLHSALPRIE